MGREEGGGFRMGNTCMPVADSFLYMAEPINIVKFKNKIKLKNKKIKTHSCSFLSTQVPAFNFGAISVPSHSKYLLGSHTTPST